MSDQAREDLAERISQSLRMVVDPELGESIVDLGLIYDMTVAEDGVVRVEMTTTSPGCPAAAYLKEAVQSAARIVEGVQHVEVRLIYDPPWTPDRMNAKARAHLGYAKTAANA